MGDPPRDGVRLDTLGNMYKRSGDDCVHFTRFTAFDEGRVADQKQFERHAASGAERAAERVGTCFKCGGSGHWARDCGGSERLGEATPVASAAVADTATPTTAARRKPRKPAPNRRPRVLLKQPPAWQRSVKSALASK